MSRLGELTAKIDGFFSRVESRYGDDMQCATGCSDCCHVRLTITQVEADAIRAHVTALPAAERIALRTTFGDDRCAGLDVSGRCRVYAARPVVCRSHGVPIRMRRDSLPVIAGRGSAMAGSAAEGQRGVIESCFRNFTDDGPEEVSADCVLDQTTLSAMVLAVDRDAGHDGTRIDLAMLLAELAA